MIPDPNAAWSVKGDLLEGYGVEDIAARRDVSIAWVRHKVSIMRDRGELVRMWGSGDA